VGRASFYIESDQWLVSHLLENTPRKYRCITKIGNCGPQLALAFFDLIDKTESVVGLRGCPWVASMSSCLSPKGLQAPGFGLFSSASIIWILHT